MKYTSSQEAAIKCLDKNIQIIACAGSGKTEVVAHRVAALLKKGLKPANIVAFTFTDRAAAELKERIVARCRQQLGIIHGLAEMYIGTIHGFCLDLLMTEVPKYLKFRWLTKLIQKEFGERLGGAQILWLSDFQEVVAKGLAVECARRFYNKEGDFSSVTYNRLCLLLDPDRTGYEPKAFRPRIAGLPDMKEKPGILLPSASILQNFLEKPMLWRVKLDHAPRRQLDYYFLRSSFDPEDLKSPQNVADHTVFTPKDCTFDAAMQVELLVKPDGTAQPRFIYREGRTPKERIQVDGKAFYLDMTCSQVELLPSAYVGLDFGTSNTSISYVDQLSIATYEKRASEKTWVDLSDLVGVLPYPLASPLSQYLSQSDSGRMFQKAREFVEAALCLGAYISYLECCIIKDRASTRLLKGFTQRSVGPLWKLLKESLIKLEDNKPFSGEYSELIEDSFAQLMEQTVKLL
jgi:hypothetical protein